MKILCNRIKSTLQADATILTYVQPTSIQIVSPDLLPDISDTILPYIGVAPVSTSEKWYATGKIALYHVVRVYIVQQLEIFEAAIVGDSVKPGLFELLDYVKNALRTKYFAVDGTNYLSKPSLISGVRYGTSGYGDSMYCFVATVDLDCQRLADVTVT